MALLDIRGLRSDFGGPFDLQIDRGECISIVGRSGAGKSVFLRLVADLDPGSGTVLLDERLRESWTAPQWRAQVIYQAAEPAWWADTVRAHFPAGSGERAAALSTTLGIAPALLDADVTRLSTGERQRLALVRSLAGSPRIVLLDEPSAALDAESTRRMERLLGRCQDDGLAIVLVTHSIEQAHRLGRRHFEMIDHRLVAR
ncbi:ATP-binding cassette domain-containing protein [soil metagenome]